MSTLGEFVVAQGVLPAIDTEVGSHIASGLLCGGGDTRRHVL